jgi:hypothetical protein
MGDANSRTQGGVEASSEVKASVLHGVKDLKVVSSNLAFEGVEV